MEILKLRTVSVLPVPPQSSKPNLRFYALSLKQRKLLGEAKRPEMVSQPSNPYNMEDACSFLEHLRAYQLGNILGKYKLF